MLEQLRKLCTPAFLYFVISSISILSILIQNVLQGDRHTYCVGNYRCHVTSSLVPFIGKVLYMLLVTLGLNELCRRGYSNLSWFIFLFPFIMMFVLIGAFMMSLGTMEQHYSHTQDIKH
jgi:hypothetical protein